MHHCCVTAVIFCEQILKRALLQINYQKRWNLNIRYFRSQSFQLFFTKSKLPTHYTPNIQYINLQHLVGSRHLSTQYMASYEFDLSLHEDHLIERPSILENPAAGNLRTEVQIFQLQSKYYKKKQKYVSTTISYIFKKF